METTNRDGGNGQFVHALDTICKCGHRVGAHAAKAVGGIRECFEVGCTCERVRKMTCEAVR